MKKSLSTILAVIVFCGFHAYPQGPGICSDPVSSIIDRLWKSATEGELLTTRGRERASGFFLNHDPWPDATTIRVMSNFWGPASLRYVNGDEAEVELGYFDAGTIDAKLRYTPPKPLYYRKMRVVKTSFVYRLKLADTHWNMYKSDGKAIDKVMTARRHGRSRVRTALRGRPSILRFATFSRRAQRPKTPRFAAMPIEP